MTVLLVKTQNIKSLRCTRFSRIAQPIDECNAESKLIITILMIMTTTTMAEAMMVMTMMVMMVVAMTLVMMVVMVTTDCDAPNLL